MLKSIKGNVKLFVECFKAAYETSQMLIIPFEGRGVIKNIPYNKCNLAVRASGALFGMATKDGIITDDLFNELSENGKEFIVRHEKAHIELGHLKYVEGGKKDTNKILRERAKASHKGEVHHTELEADRQAAKEMGCVNAIHALLEMNLLMVDKYGFKNKEINKRITKLMSIQD